MSKFSDYLQFLIKRRGESISAVSRNACVERTWIHKPMTGERSLSYKNTRQLADYLQLSPKEMQTFLEYHAMLLQGEAAFETRNEIVQFMVSFASLDEAILQQDDTFRMEGKEKIDAPEGFWAGEHVTRTVLRTAIRKELMEPHPQITLMIPMMHGYFFHFLCTLYRQYDTNLRITHIVPIEDADQDDSVARIRILKYSAALSLIAEEKYKAAFFYDHGDHSAMPFPYYVLTSSQVLFMDGSFENIMSVTNLNIRQYVSRTFQQTFLYTHPLIQMETGEDAVLKMLMEPEAGGRFFRLAWQPFLVGFASRSEIRRRIRPECLGEDSVWRKALEYPDFIWKLKNVGYHFLAFTKEGIRSFMEEGIIPETIRDVSSPFSEHERILLLERLIRVIEEDIMDGRLINELLLDMPKGLRFGFSATRFDIYLGRSDESDRVYNMSVPSLNLAKTFLDFAEYLPRSEYVLDKEETLLWLRELAQEYRVRTDGLLKAKKPL